jgi:cobaltochelatase CobN
MHLSIKHSQLLEDAEIPLNPLQTPADILLLSFTDSDLSCMAEAAKNLAININYIRISSLTLLKHPLSVDLYIEQVATHAKVILVRLLGGYDWWKYGVDELGKLARKNNIKLLMVSGCHSDHRLSQLSTVPEQDIIAVENCLAQGGVENAKRVLRYLQGGEAPIAEIIENGKLYDVSLFQNNKQAGNALIIFYRAHYLAADIAPIDAMISALATCDISARAFMVTSLKDEFALANLKTEIANFHPDVIIDATAFSAGVTAHPLAYVDVPILQIALANMSFEDWQNSKRGLSTSDMAMQVVLPEADGRIFTRAISLKTDGERHDFLEFTHKFNQPEIGRVKYVALLATAWINLRKKPNAKKKIALILSDYPQRLGRNSYAVGLDAMQSVDKILEMLTEEGYVVSDKKLEIKKYSIEQYQARFASLSLENQAALIAIWGQIPQQDFEIEIQQYGNISVALQPDRGSIIDKKTGYHDAQIPPSHNYLAFYWWLRDVQKIDALIHLGTHGNLEWLPAKNVALSADCWPEIALGATPVIYPYIVSDAGEAAQAKRRISAVIISHLTPPLQNVSLSPELALLEILTDEYSSADGLDGRRMKHLRDEIIFQAKKSGLLFVDNNADDVAVLTALEAHLCDIKEQRVGDGLHIFGAGENHECATSERKNLLAALSGKFIMPSVGGAPSRGRIDIFPTGRNLIGVDPRMIPTKTAAIIGKRAAADFIRRFVQDNGEFPQNIMMDLWGSATLRTGGDEIAQALALMGVNLLWEEGTNRVLGFEIIPDYELEWQRVDVSLRISGLFRDMFYNLILLFDDCVQAIAKLQNKPTAIRIFSNAPSAYGAGTTELIDAKIWKTRAELGQAYINSSNFAYGRGADGVVADAALRERIKITDALIHVQDLREVDVLSGADFADSEGGFAAAAHMLGASPALYHVDTSNPEYIKTRLLAEEISLTLHARAINPQWIAGQMRHGYAGAACIADVVDNLFAFSATSNCVVSTQFDAVADAYLHDIMVREFLEKNNPQALKAIISRLNEARERGMWQVLRNSTLILLEEMA